MTSPDTLPHVGLWRRSCLEIAHQLACTRASVWVFEPGDETIRCVCLVDVRSGRTTAGQRILRSEHPAYFDALRVDGQVLASNAHKHPATRSFADSYFYPNGILSMLDHLIVDGDSPLGLVCCEHCEGLRLWTEGDLALLADLIEPLRPGLREQRELSRPQAASSAPPAPAPARRKGDLSSSSST